MNFKSVCQIYNVFAKFFRGRIFFWLERSITEVYWQSINDLHKVNKDNISLKTKLLYAAKHLSVCDLLSLPKCVDVSLPIVLPW